MSACGTVVCESEHRCLSSLSRISETQDLSQRFEILSLISVPQLAWERRFKQNSTLRVVQSGPPVPSARRLASSPKTTRYAAPGMFGPRTFGGPLGDGPREQLGNVCGENRKQQEQERAKANHVDVLSFLALRPDSQFWKPARGWPARPVSE